jgi:hypothetical protein
MRWDTPPTPGVLLEAGLCCPSPSSLNRPHPPHSRAHRDFTARRLIRDAFAVRERRSNPRAVPVFRCPFLPDMPSPRTPGSSNIDQFQTATSTLAFAKSPTARHSQCSSNPLHAVKPFRGLHGSHICYGLPGTRLLGALCGSDRSPAIGAFYFQASNGSVALPVAGYDYSIDWTPMLVGLSPTGMAARLGARASVFRDGRLGLAIQVEDPAGG